MRKIPPLKAVWIAIVFLIAVGAISSCFRMPGNDWIIYIKAARMYVGGDSIYNVLIKQSVGANYYVYSPLFVFLLVPVSMLPIYFSMALWYLLKLFLLYRVFTIVGRSIGYYLLPDKKKALVLAVAFLFSIRFLLYDFDLGQVTVFLLWSMIEGWRLVYTGKIITGTMLLAFGVFIKAIPIVFLPYLIYKRKTRATVFYLLWVLIMFLLPFVAGRVHYNMGLYSNWLTVINPFPAYTNVIPPNTSLNDLYEIVSVWHAALQSLLQPIIHLSDLSIYSARTITYIIISCFGIGFICLCHAHSFDKIGSKRTDMEEIIYIISLVPLVFPHQQKYSYVLMFPLMLYIAFKLFAQQKKLYYYIPAGVAFALMVLSTDGVIGRSLNMITQYFSFISIGGIILIILFFIYVNNYEKASKKGEITLNPH